MLINNHFFMSDTNIRHKLDKEFLTQAFGEEKTTEEISKVYERIARSYAQVENAVAVLSDLYAGVSHIYFGGLSETLGIAERGDAYVVRSVWEEEILRLIDPDDLQEKYLQELRFFRFLKRVPKNRRTDFYLTGRLRMRDAANGRLPIQHRLFYVPGANESLRMALCLYNSFPGEAAPGYRVVNSANGHVVHLADRTDCDILSGREKEVLRLIGNGATSRDTARTLSVSVHTVNRHRQNILAKLRVKNSLEACRMAKEMKWI